MTMELVYFFLFIAASGAIIFWYGHRSVVTRKRSSALSSQQKHHVPDDSTLALRRSSIGKTRVNRNHADSREKSDVWKKDHQRRRDLFNENTESIHGKKYTYTPPAKSRSSAARSDQKSKVVNIRN